MNLLGQAITKSFESCKLKAYWDSVGRIWTIGWGTTNHVYEGMEITQAQADAWLMQHWEECEHMIAQLVEVDLTPNEISALIDFVYNEGIGRFHGSSMLKFINEGEMQRAVCEFVKWDIGDGKVEPGLLERRKAEAALFRGDEAEVTKILAARGYKV